MATALSRASAPRGRPRAGAPPALLVRRVLRDGRTRTISFTYLFALVAYVQPISYRHTYPTVADRLAFARSFGHNKAVVLFYGTAHDLLSVGGYSAWRVGGTLAIFGAVFGVLAGVRALRAEEEAGRTEVVLAAAVHRATVYRTALVGIGVMVLVLWLALSAGLLLGGLAAGGSAYLALSVAAVIVVFAGVGALASQIAPTRRTALELASAAVALAFVLRVVADTASGLSWLSWLTPLGWAEELRPFTGARPAVLLLFAGASWALLAGAGRIAEGRDIGTGLVASSDRATARTGLLGSSTAQAVRAESASLAVWTVSTAAFAFIVGVISRSVSSAGIPVKLQRELAKVGAGSILRPTGYIGFTFLFFVLIASLFCVSQVAAARHEENDGRLEALLALPVGRREWLSGRLAVAALATVVLVLSAGLSAWAGAALEGVPVSASTMLGAGANCLPVALLFLGVALLCYAALPRAGTGVAYGVVALAFLWQLFASLFGAPHWLVEVTPFAHVGLVPAQPFRPGAAAAMLAIGLATALAGLVVFRRRDLAGA